MCIISHRESEWEIFGYFLSWWILWTTVGPHIHTVSNVSRLLMCVCVCGVCCVCVCIVCSLSYILFFHREGNRFKKMGRGGIRFVCGRSSSRISPLPPPPHLQDVIDRKILCKSGKYFFLNGIFRVPGGGSLQSSRKIKWISSSLKDFSFKSKIFIEFMDHIYS